MVCVQLNRLDRLRERRAKRDELIEQEKEKRAAAVREKIQERGEITDETGIEMQVKFFGGVLLVLRNTCGFRSTRNCMARHQHQKR